MSAPSERQQIGGVTYKKFIDYTRIDQGEFLAHWHEQAAQMLEAGTLPVRERGKGLVLRLDAWGRSVGFEV